MQFCASFTWSYWSFYVSAVGALGLLQLWGTKKLIRSDGFLSLLWAVYEQTSRLLRQRLVKMNESLLFVLFRLPVGGTSAPAYILLDAPAVVKRLLPLGTQVLDELIHNSLA